MKEIFSALSRAQAKMEAAKKDAANPFYKSDYASLQSVVETFQKFFATEGLSHFHTPFLMPDGTQALRVTLAHSSGESITGEYKIAPVKADPQGIGSAISYARRYSLACMTGIVSSSDIEKDDDGEAAQGRAGKEPGEKHKEPDLVSQSIAAFRHVLDFPAMERWRKFLLKRQGYEEKMLPRLDARQSAIVTIAVSAIVLEIVSGTLETIKNQKELADFWTAGSPDWFAHMTVADQEILTNTYQSLVDTIQPGKSTSTNFQF